MSDTNLDKCFWVYPDSATAVPPGEPRTFQLVIPEPGGTFPVTGAAVKWTIVDDTTNDDLVAGEDYQVLKGDLQSLVLTVVFKPVGRSVRVTPKVSLFYASTVAGLTTIVNAISDSNYPQFEPQIYSVEGLTQPQQDALVDRIVGALCVIAQKSVIAPGEVGLLSLVPRSLSDVPQTVTSVLDETPSVKIRGAIPVDSLVESIVGAVTGALGKVVPGSKTSFDAAGDDVRRMLSRPISIPLAIDVLGKRVSRTLAPVGDATGPVFTSTPGETNSLKGLIPIGKFQSPFEIPAPVDTAWTVTGTTFSHLTAGSGFIKSILLKPPLVELSSDPLAPVEVQVTVAVDIALQTGVFAAPSSQTLPPVTLQLLPLAIPRMAVVFRYAFDNFDNQHRQEVYIATESGTTPFMPTIADCLRLLRVLGTTLNNVVAVANALGTGWDDLIGLASAVSMLQDKVGGAREVFYLPLFEPKNRVQITRNRVSAVIFIGMPGPEGALDRFQLQDEDGTPFIGFGKGGTSHLSSILPKLDDRFADIDKIPPGSAHALETENYHNRLELLVFPGERIRLPGVDGHPIDKRVRKRRKQYQSS